MPLKSITGRFQCEFCDRSFTTKSNCKRHERSHTVALKCTFCMCKFTRQDQLKMHEKTHLSLHNCQFCTREFTQRNNLMRHERGCGDGPSNHTYEHNRNQSGGRQPNVNRVMNGAVQDRTFYPRVSDRHDLLAFMATIKSDIINYMQHVLRQHAIKWYMVCRVQLYREDRNGEIVTVEPYFRSIAYTSLTEDTLDETDINEAFQKMYAALEKYIRDASGWIVKEAQFLKVHTTQYAPLAGSSFLNLPLTLKRNQSVLNIRNTEDNKCFLWSILAQLHHRQYQSENVEHYKPYEHELNMRNIEYPVSLHHIDIFERQNSDISVNIFGYENKEIFPLRITKQRNKACHINLLLLSRNHSTHYCLIRDLDLFLYRTKTHKDRYYFCHYCLNGFINAMMLAKHLPYCSTNGAQKIVLPVKGENDILTFTDIGKQCRAPYVIYCDFETINRPIDTCAQYPDTSHTTPTRHLDVSSFGYKVVCIEPKHTKHTVIYRGPNASEKFIECLLEERETIESLLDTVEPMIITTEQELEFQRATHCGICTGPFTDVDKVHDHCHLTGLYRCAAHLSCNLQYQQPKFIPVFFHGLRNFDSHVICQSIGRYEEHGGIKCIPQNFEKYISFSLGSLRFLDSFQFLSSSLEKLTENLKCNEGHERFKHFHSEFSDPVAADLLLRKGLFPYNYVSEESKFEETRLPPQQEFYSELKKENISDADYKHACRVYSKLNMKNIGEYSDMYLKTDVLLLADIFENFRDISLRDYKLDPCHFYSAPGLSFAAMLRMTGVKLELLTDIDQLYMFESGLRGGISQISHRHAVANNYYMKDYDPAKPVSYISYLDANNLYGWAMMQKLPMRDFRFLSQDEISGFDVDTVVVDGDKGYLIECSLQYDIGLHELHESLPLAPEKRKIIPEELSPFAARLWRELNGDKCKHAAVEKLVTTLYDKDHYVLHHRNLKLYLSLGLELKAIHRVLEFHQEAWLKPYIDFNTEKRALANSEFERDFYKLLNNSVFGKLMENQKKHKDIKLAASEKRLKKLVSKPTFSSRKIFNDSLIGVESKRVKVNINKPIYAGQAVLDISKCLMYDFWYNYLLDKYGSNRCRLLMTDTDSLLFHVETNNMFVDMHESAHLFDMSNFAKDSFFHSDKNKKVPGLFKSETGNQIITRFTGLRSKMYAFTVEEKEIKKAKGISKATIDKDLHYHMFEEVLLESKDMSSKMDVIRSKSHELYVMNVCKKSLSSFDDKRYLINSVDSLPYGHYMIDVFDDHLDNTYLQ